MSLMCESKTSLHACSIEAIGRNQSIPVFACGLYELTGESSQHRDGKLVLYNYDEQSNRLSVIDEINTDGGVLDMKVCPYPSENTQEKLAVVLSTGTLSIFDYTSDSRSSDYLTLCNSISDEQDTSLYLSVSWNSSQSRADSTATQLVVSTQASSILLFEYSCSDICITHRLLNAHKRYGESLPIWVAIFDPHQSFGGNNTRLLSGGDDCCMKIWDLRQSYEKPSYIDSRSHQTGLTCAQWHPTSVHNFATGSYDEIIRVWDDRYLKNPCLNISAGLLRPSTAWTTLLHISFTVGGGLWRLKWLDNQSTDVNDVDRDLGCIATANMHAGSGLYRISRTEGVDSQLLQCDKQDVCSNEDNQLVYGIDVLKAKHSPDKHDSANGRTEFLLATCSFYENNVQVWRVRS